MTWWGLSVVGSEPELKAIRGLMEGWRHVYLFADMAGSAMAEEVGTDTFSMGMISFQPFCLNPFPEYDEPLRALIVERGALLPRVSASEVLRAHNMQISSALEVLRTHDMQIS